MATKKKPKWQKNLTKGDIKHIKDTTFSGTLAQFRSNRKWHKETNVHCWDCVAIERKINDGI